MQQCDPCNARHKPEMFNVDDESLHAFQRTHTEWHNTKRDICCQCCCPCKNEEDNSTRRQHADRHLYFVRGMAHSRLHYHLEAISDFTVCIESLKCLLEAKSSWLSPWPTTLFNNGDNIEQNCIYKARTQEGVVRKSELVTVLLNRAMSYYAINNFHCALMDFDQAIHLQPLQFPKLQRIMEHISQKLLS